MDWIKNVYGWVKLKIEKGIYEEMVNNWKKRQTDTIIWKSLGSKSKEVQFERDILMLYKTLFPENYAYQSHKINIKGRIEKLSIDYKSILMPVKKLILIYAKYGLYYHKQKNGVFTLSYQDLKSHKFHYPLASIFTHGGRTIFLSQNQGYISGAHSFIDYLFADERRFLFIRNYASHRIVYKKKKYRLHEQKIKIKALLEKNTHRGFNIPLGGFGNLWPDGQTYIGKNGYGINLNEYGELDKVGQHGHFYIRPDDFKEIAYSTVMIGLEGEAPGQKGMFSKYSHNMMSAFKDRSADQPTLTGGVKWKMMEGLYGDYPHSIGGKIVILPFSPTVDDLLEKINSLDEKYQQIIYWILLSSDHDQSKAFIDHYLGKDYKEKIQSLLID